MKSPTKAPAGKDDGPEEGEIVSDDLEDISDDSINFTPSIGKSLSRSDHLPALSLSSITEVDEPPAERRPKRRKSYSQRHARREKKRRKVVDSDSSDNDTTLDRRLKLQLKAAVRVNVEEAHRNSLRARLRAMVKGGSGPDSDSVEAMKKTKQSNLDKCEDIDTPNDVEVVENPTVIEVIDLVEHDTTSSCVEIVASSSDNAGSAPENIDSASEQSKVDEIDSELIHLRLEALKTAITNKFANRRKKKNITSSDDTNKENTSNNSGETLSTRTSQEENKTEQTEISPQAVEPVEAIAPPSPDEDEDVLRALLLASMSKKLTTIPPESSQLALNAIQTKMAIINQNKMRINNFKVNNNVKRVVHNVKKVVNKASGATQLIRVPQVKPLIINVNSDSDSDWEFSGSSPEKSPKKTQNNSVLEPNKTVNILETATDNSAKATDFLNVIENTVEKFLKEQRAKVESEILNNNNFLSKTNTNTIEPVINPENKAAVLPVISTVKKSAVISHTTPVKPKLKVTEIEKSALKFLPASKREEYKKLQNLLKFKKAQMKKSRIRRISQKNDNGNNLKITVMSKDEETTTKKESFNKVATHNIDHKRPQQNKTDINCQSLVKNNSIASLPKAKQTSASFDVKKIVHTRATQTFETEHVQLSPQIEVRIEEFRKQEYGAAKREQERKTETTTMRSTLKQLQTKKDGRLQIQEKYKSLRPLVKKLNEVTKEQKLCNQEVERLMAELRKTRGKQETLHRNMLAAVKDLNEEKNKVDSSVSRPVIMPKAISAPITSTPIKPTNGAATFPLHSPLSSSISCTESTSPIVSDQSQTAFQKDTTRVKVVNMLNTWERSTICQNPEPMDDDNEGEITVVDPNDIDNIIKKTEEKIAVLDKNVEYKKRDKVKYVSPLDVGQR